MHANEVQPYLTASDLHTVIIGFQPVRFPSRQPVEEKVTEQQEALIYSMHIVWIEFVSPSSS